jgi:hypothetical protein
LKSLACCENQLTSLDVSQNPDLDYLACYINQLTTLDVSHNPKLWFLSFFQNQITSIDLSQNPALESLLCSNNQLTSLNLRENSAVDYLNCTGNTFDIGTVPLKLIDFDSFLPSGFDGSKASNWSGATYDSTTGTLVIDENNRGTITYDYDTGYEVVTFTLTFTPSSLSYLKGDANLDGVVDADDAYEVLCYYATHSVGANYCFDYDPEVNASIANAVDINGDGVLNAEDAYLILLYYAQASVGGAADWDSLS